jgi:hypothetical protein
MDNMSKTNFLLITLIRELLPKDMTDDQVDSNRPLPFPREVPHS